MSRKQCDPDLDTLTNAHPDTGTHRDLHAAPRPTPTPTMTPLPRARVITSERIILRRGFEGEGYTYRDGTAAPNEMITIIELREDIGWVRVRTDNGEQGWTRLDFLRR